MSCIHIPGTRRVVTDCPPFKFTAKKDRKAEVEANARHENPKIRAAAAASPHLPQVLQWSLSQDPEPEVRAWIARNPKVYNSVLSSLVGKEKDPTIRAYVAANPGVYNGLLQILCEDEDPRVAALARTVLDTRRAEGN